jgi:DNA-binding transcriptional regulator GbsR (MarR family)
MIKFVIVHGIVQMAMTNLHVTVRTHGIDRTMGYVYSHLLPAWFGLVYGV